MVDILYFASLRETLGIAKEQLELPDNVTSISNLKSLLAQRGEKWSDSFTGNSTLLVSVNQQMADDLSSIKHNDEIAFFPPVTGG